MTTAVHTRATEPLPTAQDVAASPEAFADRFTRALNDAALMVMTSVGHRTGLFDAMEGGEAMTSSELAAAAGLQERYVREWLGAMATGRIVELVGEERYRLPEQHAVLLTRNAPENFAVFAQYIPVMAGVEDHLVRCFREGGGIPYERYHRFHEVMAEDSGQTVLSALQQHIIPLVPGLEDRLRQGIDVIDLGCGRGLALLKLAERYPASRFEGMDLSEEAIAYAREQVRDRGLENIRFTVRDLSDFDRTAEPDSVDLVTTFDAVHDQAHPAALLRGIVRALRPDGVYLMQDIHASSSMRGDLDHPLGPFLYSISCTHCMPVSLAQDGEGLGTMWGRERAKSMLAEAGFGDVEIHQLEHDVQNDYYVARL